MTVAGLAVALGVASGALITAVGSLLLYLYQHRSALQNEHRMRAFERHLPHYEHIFVTARSAQDALSDYVTVDRRVSDRSDPFLYQLLSIFADSARQYCAAVTWRNNPGMVYLDLPLEEACLRARDLLLRWLSQQKVTSGDIALVRRAGTFSQVAVQEIRSLQVGDYEELRIETRRIVRPASGDARLLSDIASALSSVIVKLKAVMAY